MQFFECATNYIRAKRMLKEMGHKQTLSPKEWYDQMRNTGYCQGIAALPPEDRMGNTLISLDGECDWMSKGEPYFKVYPAMASMMSGISIDIPVSTFQSPYSTFVILLADDPANDIQDIKGPRLKWVMVEEVYVLFESLKHFKILKDPGSHPDAKNLTKALYFNYEFEGEWKGEPQQFNYTMSLNPDVGTFEDFFNKTWGGSYPEIDHAAGEYCPSKEVVLKIIKLAIATAFFGVDQHEVVMPDLPRKKLERKVRNCVTVSSAVSAVKESRPDTKKWTIGREIVLPRPIAVQREESNGEGKRELKSSHLRRGHMRWQAVGEGRQQRKLTFIHPHMIRPDLPLQQKQGYRIGEAEKKT